MQEAGFARYPQLELSQPMSEEKSSSIGTMIVVAIAAGLIGYVIGKPNQAQEEASKPTEPAKPDVPHAVKWNGHWYALVDDKDYTITEAREKAKALGGHLPYINSKEEEELILSLAKEKKSSDRPCTIKRWMGVGGWLKNRLHQLGRRRRAREKASK